jgi:amino-acid N-acetyltransferase
MPEFSLRSARPSDLPGVLALLAERRLAPNHVETQFGPQYAVAETPEGDLIGVAGVERYEGDGLFRSAAVSERYAGQGIGETLTRDRLSWARREGLRALYLLTETAADYWPRFGFVRVSRDSAPEPIRRSPEWAGGCPASAVAMRLDLDGSLPADGPGIA